MAPVAFTGALAPKKKSELQEICIALRLSDQGTKEELYARIKKHLDANPSLEDNPRFAGLFGRRKRSLQPQPPPPSTRTDKPRSSNRILGLEPIRETTPVKDLRDVFKRLPSPVDKTPERSPRETLDFTTPSSLPPLPPSPAKSLLEHLPNTDDVRAAVRRFHHQDLLPHGTEFLEATRTFLSNSRNIWTVSALFEVLCILSAVIPWKYLQLPIFSGRGFSVPYPPMSVFQTTTFWLVLLHWALPTLIVPAFVGNLISFNQPAEEPSQLSVTFDPLTAAIVRLAVSIAYPYASLSTAEKVYGLDVLGYNLRVFSAAVGLAFSFAEAIAGAPRLFARTLVQEQRLTIAPASSETKALEAAFEESAEVD